MLAGNNQNQVFLKGQEAWRKNDYIKAKFWYEQSLKYPNFKNQSLSKLIQIEIRQGKYKKAREILNTNKNNNSVDLKQICGLLENIENNFGRSKKYYSECMIDPKMQAKSLLAISKLYVQTGDYDVARKMLETLTLNDYFEIQSLIGLICMSILEHDFYKAYKLLEQIDENKLTPKLSQHYLILKMYVRYFLGQVKLSENNYDPVKDYMIYRLFDRSDETLIKHISKHFNYKDRYTNGCFFRYLDADKLLKDARNKIENMNGNHFEVSDMYRFRLDTPIGYKDDEITSDLCVVTMLGTKDILTMYPVSLSDEFDKEGLSTSDELRLKRIRGGSLK